MNNEQYIELVNKVKQRLKTTLQIPAEFAKTPNSQTSIEERKVLMNMIEDILFYIEDWEENRTLLYKAIQNKYKEEER